MEKEFVDMLGKLFDELKELKTEIRATREEVTNLSLESHESHEYIKRDLKYLTHKINELDRELFMRTESINKEEE